VGSVKTIHQLKVTLKDIKPPVWRRVQVPSSMTRLAPGYPGSLRLVGLPPHEFDIGGVRYGIDDGEGWDPPKDERRARLERLVPVGARFGYVYDFGDHWEHAITVEKVLGADPKAKYPICVTGRRACPPEDCGGAWGYADFLEAIGDPNHEEHNQMLEWVGGSFDPEHFDRNDFESNLKRGPVLD
jgi:hypothetical protein